MKNPAFKARSRSGSRVSKKATSYRQTDEAIIFRLYGTDIVTVYPKKVILNSGGYRTVTTKRRMNQISEELGLGYTIYTVRGEWVVVDRLWESGKAELRFSDGMTLYRR
jgi:hypothetical protein